MNHETMLHKNKSKAKYFIHPILQNSTQKISTNYFMRVGGL